MSPRQVHPDTPKVELTIGGLVRELLARFDKGDQVAAYSGCCGCGGMFLTFEDYDGVVTIIGHPHE